MPSAYVRPRHYCGLIVLLLVSATAQAQSNDFADLSLTLAHDDNLSRALLDRDIVSDDSLRLAISGGRFYPLALRDSLTLSGSLSRTQFREFSGLSSLDLSLGASHQHKFGLGAYATTLSNALTLTHVESETEVRKRQLLNWDLSLRKRLSPRWEVSAGLGYERSEGLEDSIEYASMYSPVNDIYDFEQGSAFASAEYTFANDALLSASYTYVDGNSVSSALAPNAALLAISKDLTPDGAFPAPPMRTIVAYTLASKSHLTALNWNLPLGQNTSLTVGLAHQKITARAGVDYRNTQFSLTLLQILK